MNACKSLTLKDGYNGHTITVSPVPVAVIAPAVRLSVVGSPHLLRWSRYRETCVACGQSVETHLKMGGVR